MAAGDGGRVVGRLADFAARIGHGHAQAHGAQDRQIGQVVAQVANLVPRQPQLGQNLLQRGQLVGMPWRTISTPNSAARILRLCELRCVNMPKR